MNDILKIIIQELLHNTPNNIEYFNVDKLTIHYYKPEAMPGEMTEEKLSDFIKRVSKEIELIGD